jgi:tRNA(Ile2) C34 agmatinyltransferase TiaS
MLTKIKEDGEQFYFDKYGSWLTKKEISKIYLKRRKILEDGNCVRCGSLLKSSGITKHYECLHCGTNLEELCFESELKNRNNLVFQLLNQFIKN